MANNLQNDIIYEEEKNQLKKVVKYIDEKIENRKKQ